MSASTNPIQFSASDQLVATESLDTMGAGTSQSAVAPSVIPIGIEALIKCQRHANEILAQEIHHLTQQLRAFATAPRDEFPELAAVIERGGAVLLSNDAARKLLAWITVGDQVATEITVYRTLDYYRKELAWLRENQGAELAIQQQHLAKAEDTLAEIMGEFEKWAGAYPVDIFPEPDLTKVADALAAAGFSLDGVAATVMRKAAATALAIVERVGGHGRK